MYCYSESAMQFRPTFNILLHFEVVLKEEHTFAISEAATKHSVVLDALVTHVGPLFVRNDIIGHIPWKTYPVWRQEANPTSQECDG